MPSIEPSRPKPSTLPSPPRDLSPGWLGLLAVTLAALGYLFGTAFADNGFAGDSWWSWAVGRVEWTRHHIVTTNVLANGPHLVGKPWTNLEWGWQALLAGVAGTHAHPQWAGLAWLGLLSTALACLAVMAGLRVLQGHWDPLRLVFLTVPVTVFWFPFYSTLRPQILSGVFWIALLLLLWIGQTRPRWLWATVPLALLWSPFHGDWILVPLLLGVDTLWQWGTHQPHVRLRAGLTALSLLVPGLLNPYGLYEIVYIHWLDGNVWIHHITEWMPPDFADNDYRIWLALIVGGLALAVWRTQRDPGAIPPRLWLWFGGTFVMTMLERRMALYFAPVFAWLVVLALPLPPALAWRPRWTQVVGGVAAFAVGWGLAYTTLPHPWQRSMTPLFHWVERHPTPGLTFIDPEDAGEWEALKPATVGPIFADGRADFFLKQAPSRIPWEYYFFSTGVPLQSFAKEDITRVIWRNNPGLGFPVAAALTLHLAHWHKVATIGAWMIWDPPTPLRPPRPAQRQPSRRS